MKVVDLVQQSPEWLAFKGKRVGASQIAAILGHSEYSTAYDIWISMTGRYVPTGKPNIATARGNYFESLVRAKYELKTWLKLLPLTAVHDDHDRIMCSFDGIDTQKKVIIEIKIPKREVIDAAEHGVLPEELQRIAKEWKIAEFCTGGLVHPTYYPQVQYQLGIAGPDYELVFLVGEYESVNGKERITKIHEVKVRPDPEFQAWLFISALGFLDLVDKDIQPPLTDRDTMELTDESSVGVFSRLGAAKELVSKSKSKEVKDAFDLAKEEAIEHCEVVAKHVNVKAAGIVLRKDKNGKWSVRKA